MKNLLEDVVRDVHAELLRQYTEFCSCAACRTDVEALALNMIRPRYSGGDPTGQALLALDLQKDQMRATIAVLVLEAMRRVGANPRHPQPPVPPAHTG
ncbi:MAG TPA: late competence development ComFB family protein [Gemmatimonadaceae bacterium]|nr:late competence development ComFB family protein [Gemmatimonadaceae bacterium]